MAPVGSVAPFSCFRATYRECQAQTHSSPGKDPRGSPALGRSTSWWLKGSNINCRFADSEISREITHILWMEEILHHLVWLKPYNYGINHLSTGAGFLPSTVWQVHLYMNHGWTLWRKSQNCRSFWCLASHTIWLFCWSFPIPLLINFWPVQNFGCSNFTPKIFIV